MKQARLCLCLNLLCILNCLAQSPIRTCATDELHQAELLNPAYYKIRKEIDNHLKNYQASRQLRSAGIIIPVVVHIVYNSSSQDISDQRVISQIDVLNRDFGQKLNSKYTQASSSQISFQLATVDPKGFSTTGITRTKTTKSSFQSGPGIMSVSSGGEDPWPSKQYLNIWVGNLSGILGFAYLPGGVNDGVAIGYQYFGSNTSASPYHLGRTATHEIGHWLNLQHIWGPSNGCGIDDEVSDTPDSQAPNYKCNTGHQSCGTTDMVENYMDYSDDACMSLFTLKQVERMEALFASRGFRESIKSSTGLGLGTTNTCNDGIKNGNETGIDCGGNCTPCATCNDGIKNGNETGIDCGGNCTPCATCNDGIKNGNETGIDCGGNCTPCATCNDGIKNGNETGIDCGGNCTPCATCNDGIKNGNETGIDCGGNCKPCTTCNDGIKNGNETGIDCGGNCTPCATCNDGIKNGNETGIDCGGNCNPCATCNDGIKNGNETGIDCGGNCNPCATCNDGIKNGNETGIDCGGNCNPCATCNDGIKNGNETGIDCGGNCTPCATCNDGIKNGNETGIDCGGNCTPCATCNDGIKNGNETGIDCGGNCTPCATCNDGIKNGNETGIDCGGLCVSCSCTSTGTNSQFEYIDQIKINDSIFNSGNNNGFWSSNKTAKIKSDKGIAFRLSPGFMAGSSYEYWNIWVDWNKNGIFGDQNELLLQKSGNGIMQDTIYLNKLFANTSLPANAVYKLRVQMKWRGYAGACQNIDFGEVEEYYLELVPNNILVDPCINGLQDPGEDGIDCGKNCKPCSSLSYCSSSGKNTQSEFIKSVQLGNYIHPSGNNNGYLLVSNSGLTARAGESLYYRCVPGFGGSYMLMEYWTMYADWNGDGDFQDNGELVTKSYTASAIYGNVMVPNEAAKKVRIRIQMKDANYALACDQISYGEVEDYDLEIISQQARIANRMDPAITIFPNPAKNKIKLEFNNYWNGSFKLTISNLFGLKIVHQNLLLQNDKYISLDLPQMVDGIYLIRLEGDNKYFENKLMISNK